MKKFDLRCFSKKTKQRFRSCGDLTIYPIREIRGGNRIIYSDKYDNDDDPSTPVNSGKLSKNLFKKLIEFFLFCKGWSKNMFCLCIFKSFPVIKSFFRNLPFYTISYPHQPSTVNHVNQCTQKSNLVTPMSASFHLLMSSTTSG